MQLLKMTEEQNGRAGERRRGRSPRARSKEASVARPEECTQTARGTAEKGQVRMMRVT